MTNEDLEKEEEQEEEPKKGRIFGDPICTCDFDD